MVEKLCKEYANYIVQTNLPLEIDQICTSIDDILTRLEEFEGVMALVKGESNVSVGENIPDILDMQFPFENLCTRIDNLERFIAVANKNLTVLEQSVDKAEDKLGLNDQGIKGLLKPLFGRTKVESVDAPKRQTDLTFVSPDIFRTGDFFPTVSNVPDDADASHIESQC